MARILFDEGLYSVIDDASAIGVGWRLAFYTANTVSPITTYNAPSGGSANTNPVLSDADGRFPQIWINDGQTIKWSLADDLGNVLVTVDDFEIPATPPSFNPALDDFLAGIEALPVQWGGTGNSDAGNALAALGGYPTYGGNITGNIVRQGKGTHLYWDTAAMNQGNLFLTVDSDPDPTAFPGQIWLKYS